MIQYLAELPRLRSAKYQKKYRTIRKQKQSIVQTIFFES